MTQFATYADQTVGFETEIQNFQLDTRLQNKTEIVRIYSIDDGNKKPFMKLVSEGADTIKTSYVEIVSEPYSVQEKVELYFKAIKIICNNLDKRNELGKDKSLKNFFEKIRGNFDKLRLTFEFVSREIENYKLQMPNNTQNCVSNIHINVALPFKKLLAFAKCGLFPEGDIRTAVFPYVCKQVEEKFGEYQQNLKSLLALHLYQYAVYSKLSLEQTKIYLKVNEPYKNVKDNNSNKLSFNVLFKVSKADIIRNVLSEEECEKLSENAVRTKICNLLENNETLFGVPRKKISDKKEYYCGALCDNARRRLENRDEFIYDEPRISGLLPTVKMENGDDYYIVAEIRKKEGLSLKITDNFKNALNDNIGKDESTFSGAIAIVVKSLSDFIKKVG